MHVTNDVVRPAIIAGEVFTDTPHATLVCLVDDVPTAALESERFDVPTNAPVNNRAEEYLFGITGANQRRVVANKMTKFVDGRIARDTTLATTPALRIDEDDEKNGKDEKSETEQNTPTRPLYLHHAGAAPFLRLRPAEGAVEEAELAQHLVHACLLYTSPSPRDRG